MFLWYGLEHGSSDFALRPSHASDLNTGTLVAARPRTWRHGVIGRTGWTAFSILLLGEPKRLSFNSFSAWNLVKIYEQIYLRDELFLFLG